MNLVHKDLSSLILESQLGLISSIGQPNILTDQDNNENRGIVPSAAASSSSASSSDSSAIGKRNRDTYESQGILSPSAKGTATATSSSATLGSSAVDGNHSATRGGVGVVIKPTTQGRGQGRGRGGGVGLFPRR